MLNTKKCKQCKKEFFPNDYRQIFCSSSCSASYNNIRKERKIYKKICSRCGEEFTIKGYEQAEKKICSQCRLEKCKYCGKKIPKSKRIYNSGYCSDKCRSNAAYYRNNKEINKRRNDKLRERRNELIKRAGEKCSICGYKKNSAALSFHHKEDEEKIINLNFSGMQRKRSLIEPEFKKCILVCENCHREIHNPQLNLESIPKLIAEYKKQIAENIKQVVVTNCVVCGMKIDSNSRKTKYCSLKCKNKAKGARIHLRQKLRRLEYKIELLSNFDFKCENCGYSKNINALSFHHKDSSEKEYNIASMNTKTISRKEFEEIKQEAEKCTLLCCNCHMEVHYPNLDM